MVTIFHTKQHNVKCFNAPAQALNVVWEGDAQNEESPLCVAGRHDAWLSQAAQGFFSRWVFDSTIEQSSHTEQTFF